MNKAGKGLLLMFWLFWQAPKSFYIASKRCSHLPQLKSRLSPLKLQNYARFKEGLRLQHCIWQVQHILQLSAASQLQLRHPGAALHSPMAGAAWNIKQKDNSCPGSNINFRVGLHRQVQAEESSPGLCGSVGRRPRCLGCSQPRGWAELTSASPSPGVLWVPMFADSG